MWGHIWGPMKLIQSLGLTQSLGLIWDQDGLSWEGPIYKWINRRTNKHPPTLCCYFTSRALWMQMEPDKNFFQMPTVNPVLCLYCKFSERVIKWTSFMKIHWHGQILGPFNSTKSFLSLNLLEQTLSKTKLFLNPLKLHFFLGWCPQQDKCHDDFVYS